MKLFYAVFAILLVLLGAVWSNARNVEPIYDCICTDDYTPVCGKDGRTYSNSCEMNCAGVELAHNGECGRQNGQD